MASNQQIPGITIPVTSVRETAWAEYKRSPGMILGSVAVIAASVAILALVRNDDALELAIIIPALFWGFVIAPLIRRVRGRMVRQFAESNGFTYQESGGLKARDGSVFAHNGHSQKYEDFVSGIFKETPFQFLHYTYTVGHGKHSSTYHRSIMLMEFKSNLPHVVVDSKQFTSISFPYAGKQLLELESEEFRQYFRLYVPREYEVEAMSILTPDVMAQLIDKSKYYDVEFINNRLYIYSSGLVDNRAKLQALFELAGTIVDELAGKLDRFKITTVAEAVPPTLKSALGGQLGQNWIVIAMIIVVILAIAGGFLAILFSG